MELQSPAVGTGDQIGIDRLHSFFLSPLLQTVRQSLRERFPVRVCSALNCLNYVSVYCLSGASSSYHVIIKVGELVPSYCTSFSCLAWLFGFSLNLSQFQRKKKNYDWCNITLKKKR